MKNAFLLLSLAVLATGCDEGGGKNDDPQPVTFENTVFENYCASQYDTNGDGVLTTDEAASVKELTLDANTDKTLSGINSLAGIEYFTGLEKLSCTGLLYTFPSPREQACSRLPSPA